MAPIVQQDRLSALRDLLARAEAHALIFLESLDSRPVMPRRSMADLRASLGGPLPPDGEDASRVIDLIGREGHLASMASAGPRFFGFVIGGSLPVALAADWLTSAWDQNTGLYAAAPATSVMEETTARWLVDLFGLPPQSSVGFVTGGQMANFTGLAAARHEVLRKTGWDVETQGLMGAPPIHVVVSREAHATIFASLRLLGLGLPDDSHRVPTDDQGRMDSEALAALLSQLPPGPTIVCAQAGNVNTGAIDPLRPIAAACERRGAWLHVDGAFGLWAAATPSLRALVDGVALADSWAVDAHKWLNVPYDCGVAICRHPAAHRASMTVNAAYLVPGDGDARDGLDWAPEFSRRARGVSAYAALRTLGRSGVEDLIERPCRLARRFAAQLAAHDGIRVLNEVVLNQVLVRFEAEDAQRADARTRAVVTAVQKDGTAWLSGTTWHEMGAMRISVSNWSTTESDVDRTVEAILAAARQH